MSSRSGITKLFQSTLPAGERLLPDPPKEDDLHISIHAPRGGATYNIHDDLTRTEGFQSTLPAGERQRLTSILGRRQKDFNPRSPRGSDPPVDTGK